MKGFYLKRYKDKYGQWVGLWSGVYEIQYWCYPRFIKYFRYLKLKPGEKIPVNIKITRRTK